MPVNIKDIAKALGIAPSTVSRALQGAYGVKEETRLRIKQKADEMGYVINVGARELVQGKTNLVGIIICDYEQEARPPLFETFSIMKRQLSLSGKETIILSAGLFDYKEGQYEEMCRLRRLEGTIILGPFGHKHPLILEAQQSAVPSIIYNEPIVGEHCSSIGADDEQGVFDAVSYLIEEGHRRIGFVNGFPGVHICERRLAGYRRALTEARIEFKEHYVMDSDFSGKGGAEAASKLYERDPSITAIMFANDLMAMGAISGFHQRGIYVPEHLSVIGFDGLFIGEFYNPPLSTVLANDYQMSMLIPEMLMKLIAGETGTRELIECELMIRLSVSSIRS